MPSADQIQLDPARPVIACNGGLFLSRGEGTHPARVIDSFEIILVRRGRLGIEEQGRPFAVHAGQTLLLWPDRPHRGTEPYKAELSFYWLHFRLPKAVHRTAKRVIVPQLATLPEPDRLAEMMRRFLDDQEAERLTTAAANLWVTLMLCEIGSAAGAQAVPPHGAAVLAGRASAYIAANLHRPISTASIAEALDCNPDYLGRAFRRACRRSIIEEIHRRRVKLARQLLRDSALNVDQIAARVGFDDPGYFRRIFLRLEGISPRRYRQLYARTHINS